VRNILQVMMRVVKIDLDVFLRLPLSSFFYLLAYLDLESEEIEKGMKTWRRRS